MQRWHTPVSRQLGLAVLAALPVLLAVALLRGRGPLDPERVYLVVALLHYVQVIVTSALRPRRR